MVRIGRFQNDSSVRLFCSHYNVTEMKLGEEALRESEARFRQLADSMPQIVWSATPDGRIDYQNKKFFEQTGLTPEKAVAPGLWQKILQPDDAAIAAAKWDESVKTGHQFEMEYRYVDSQQGYRWHLGRALPVGTSRGRLPVGLGPVPTSKTRRKLSRRWRRRVSNSASMRKTSKNPSENERHNSSRA